MKKILYSVFCLLSATAMFTSCSDEIGENGSVSMSGTPALDVAGIYNGQLNAKVDWVTDNALTEPKNRTLVNSQVDGKVVMGTVDGNNYVSALTVIGQDGVAGIAPDGSEAVYNLLGGDETTESLKSKVNIFQTSNGVYNLVNKVGNTDPSMGLLTTGGVNGSVEDGVLTLGFTQQEKISKTARIDNVVNAAYGLCSQDENSGVFGTSTVLPTYTYKFTGNK